MSLDDDIRNLMRIPLFAEVELEALRLIAFSAETRILRAGDVLFHKGDVSDGGFVVLSGSLSLNPEIEGGRGFQAVGAYSLVGELALLTQTERPVTATARDATTVLKITRPMFQRVLKEFPKTAARLRVTLESRLIAFTRSTPTSDGFRDSLG